MNGLQKDCDSEYYCTDICNNLTFIMYAIDKTHTCLTNYVEAFVLCHYGIVAAMLVIISSL